MQPLSDCTGLFFTVFLLRVFTFFCMSFFIRFFWHGFFYSLSFYLREFFSVCSFEELHGLVFLWGQNGLIFFGVQSPVIAARNNRQPFDLFFLRECVGQSLCAVSEKNSKIFQKSIFIVIFNILYLMFLCIFTNRADDIL